MKITGMKEIYPHYFENVGVEVLEQCQDESTNILESDMECKLNDYDLVPYYKKIYDIMISMNIKKDSLYERMIEYVENGAYLGCVINKATVNAGKSILIPDQVERDRLNAHSRRFRLSVEVRASEIAKYYNKKIRKNSFTEYKEK
jgi:hypothetical protein